MNVANETSEAGVQQAASFPGAFGGTPRLEAIEAVYAYVSHDRETPVFSLGPLNLAARAGEFVALLGANASGKTTALRMLSGALRPLSGRVRLEGAEVSNLPARERAQRVAVVAQETTLMFPLRVWEYVLQGRYPYSQRMHFESSEDCSAASQALQEVGAAHLGSRWMNRLSGGEKQRVILARSLAQQPTLLLLDEPTQHLDIGGKVELMRSLWRLARMHHYTVLIVTHELNLAAGFCDQVALLHRGKCLAVGTPRHVYQREVLETAFQAPLQVQLTNDGMPRVLIQNYFDGDFAGIAGSSTPAAHSGDAAAST